MKPFLYTFGLLLIVMMAECKQPITTEEIIEEEFFRYADENIPSSHKIEVESILLKDSVFMADVIKNIEKLLKDTIHKQIHVSPTELAEMAYKDSKSGNYDAYIKVKKYAESSFELYNFQMKNNDRMNYITDSISSFLSNHENLKYNFYYIYRIRVNMNTDKYQRHPIFYALYDNMFYTVIIQDHDFDITEFPFMEEIGNLLTEFVTLYKEYLKMVTKVKEDRKAYFYSLFYS